MRPANGLEARLLKSAFAALRRAAQALHHPHARLVIAVVDLLDTIPLTTATPKATQAEYMLGKIASAGQTHQFRTPPHHRT